MTSIQRPWRPSRAIPEQERLLTTREVAQRLNVSIRAVQAWTLAGKVPTIRTPGGHRRIPESALQVLLVARNEATGEQVQW